MQANNVFGRVLAKLASAGAVLLMSLIGFAGVAQAQPTSDVSKYLIGPGDMLQISVWHNPELSTNVPVRPDGRISTPLVDDETAAGKTPQQLGRDIETR